MTRKPQIYALKSKVILGFLLLFLMISRTALYAGEVGVPKVFPGMHTSKITGMAFTKNGKQLISSSQDGTIHFWGGINKDWEITRSIYTSKGEEIYTIAISPDEKTLVVAGNLFNKEFNFYIKVYDLNTGDIKKIVRAHKGSINTLNFSKDGKYLLSAGVDKEIKIWKTSNWKLHKVLQGHTGHILDAAFIGSTKDIVSGSFNGEVFIWKKKSNHFIELAGSNYSKPVYKLSVSSNEKDIYFGKGRVFYHYNRNGKKINDIDLKTAGDISSVEINSIDSEAYVFVINPNKSYRIDLTNYDVQENKIVDKLNEVANCSAVVTTLKGHNESLFFADVCGDILLVKNEKVQVLGGRLNLGGVTNIRLNKSSDKFIWNIERLEQTYQLELNENAKKFNEPTLIKDDVSYFNGVLHKYHSKTIKRSTDNRKLSIFNGKKLLGVITKDSKSGFQHIAYSFLMNGKSIISGGANGSLIQYSLKGKIEAKYKGHHEAIQSVAVTKNGKYMISGAVDNMLKIWSLESKKLLLSIYHHPDGERWIAWSPSGYYEVSPNGQSIFGWVFDNGINKKTKFVSATQVSRKYYRPDIIDSILRGVELKVKNFTQNDLGDIPEVIVLSPENNEISYKKEMLLSVNTKFAENIKVFVNGAYIDNEKGLARVSTKTFTRNIILKKGANKIEIIAENKYAKSPKVVLNITGKFKAKASKYIYHSLKLVSIGANSGDTNSTSRLHYADDDAKRIADFYKKKGQARLSLTKVITTLASDSIDVPSPTRKNILKSLKVFEKSKPEDLNILYLSGHGIYIDNKYYFVPDDFKRDSKGYLKTASLVSWDKISSTIISAKGTKIVFIDTCYSGITNLTRIGNELQNGGVYVVSATDNKSKAREYTSIEGGAFSYAVMKSLNRRYGRNDFVPKEITFIDALSNIVQVVTEFSRNTQRPYMSIAGSNITIAMEQ